MGLSESSSRAQRTPLRAAHSVQQASPLRSRVVRIGGAVIVVVSAAVLLWTLLQPAPATSTTSTPAPLVGHPAPDVTLLDLHNTHVSLSSLRGKVVLLNFWYVACPPCQTEMPALEQAYRDDQSRGLVVVGVDVSDDAQTISTFLTRLGITYPIWRDVGQRATLQFRLTDTPTSFFIDRQGVIRYKVVGPLDAPTLSRDTAALLSSK